MAKKRTRPARNTRAAVAKGLHPLIKISVIVGMLLLVMASFGAYVSRRESTHPDTSIPPMLMPEPTPQYTANAPVKEYVYAGSKLVAVSEPVQPAPNDLAVWRLSTGVWYVKGPTGTISTATWGESTDKPAPGDYDGDGKTDFCVFRPSNGNWYIIESGTTTITTLSWGQAGDLPVPADFDGDSRSELTVYRPSNQTWYAKSVASGSITQKQYGASTDTPIPSDFDGDGKADFALWRNSDATWYIWQSSVDSGTSYQWGASGDLPVPGDYDGDLKTDYAVWKTNDTWSIRRSSDGTMMSVTSWGYQGSDIAVQGDYDSDGKTDRAVWRPSTGTWYILQSGNTYTRTEVWGESGDIPVPAPYRR
ncbi:MAG: VCBS repeat-containing protein [Chloracidobacterium sp.]|nr:VCBS repeat-containing protein [Chloracidobacterium sp.]